MASFPLKNSLLLFPTTPMPFTLKEATLTHPNYSPSLPVATLSSSLPDPLVNGKAKNKPPMFVSPSCWSHLDRYNNSATMQRWGWIEMVPLGGVIKVLAILPSTY